MGVGERDRRERAKERGGGGGRRRRGEKEGERGGRVRGGDREGERGEREREREIVRSLTQHLNQLAYRKVQNCTKPFCFFVDQCSARHPQLAVHKNTRTEREQTRVVDVA